MGQEQFLTWPGRSRQAAGRLVSFRCPWAQRCTGRVLSSAPLLALSTPLTALGTAPGMAACLRGDEVMCVQVGQVCFPWPVACNVPCTPVWRCGQGSSVAVKLVHGLTLLHGCEQPAVKAWHCV